MNNLTFTGLHNLHYEKMAHKCNYRFFTEKCITTELSFNSFIDNFASFSTTGIIAFMNLKVRPVAQSLTEA